MPYHTPLEEIELECGGKVFQVIRYEHETRFYYGRETYKGWRWRYLGAIGHPTTRGQALVGCPVS